jgi:primosomal protein N' (replication factor Y) (superfamily II helicase)
MSRQQQLFDTSPPEWEFDALLQRVVATVVLNTGPDLQYDYLVPDRFIDMEQSDRLLQPGRRVRIPFGRGNRKRIGYCVEVETKQVDPGRLKQIDQVIDSASLLSTAMLRLTRWMADYYLCPWGQVLESVVPAGVRGQAGTREVELLSIPGDVRSRIGPLKLPVKQRQALEVLAASTKEMTSAQLAEEAGCSTAPIKALLKKGLVEIRTGRTTMAPANQSSEIISRQAPLKLNAEQQGALEAIGQALEANQAQGILVYGVTGSGKTEVYIRAIEQTVALGRQAIVLVPEISLTPQTVRRFRARFDSVAVLHSHLTHVQRHQEWRRIARGEVEVVVGARSAVFAPTPQLGLIVIDEEHEASFKQDSAPRYHARDVAWQRAMAERIPLVLGSATPSLESWQRAESGSYLRVSLAHRVMGRSLPDAATIDMRDPAQSRFSRGGISRPLYQAMTTALDRGGQVMLLLNRRGFSTHIQCPACGFVLECPNCQMSLTFHRQQNSTLCHCCDHHEMPPTVCPDCRSPAIRYGGLGTQKLEAEVGNRFPKYTVARMDTDSTRGRGSHERTLSAFRQGEVHILLGTQMIAKGLDFPNVTLVGVVNADTALHLPDFRAAERTFQLVAQVAGRTGRGERGGRVLVQTLSPDHPAIAAAVRHDFHWFVRQEIAQRQELGYPPFGAMIRLVIRGPQESVASEVAAGLASRLNHAPGQEEKVRILGPGEAPFAKLRGQYRFQIQLQAPEMATLQQLIRQANPHAKLPKGVFCAIDVDPWDMM